MNGSARLCFAIGHTGCAAGPSIRAECRRAGVAAQPRRRRPRLDAMATLIANVAKANQRLDDLSAAIQTEQRSVDKAIVDVDSARDNAVAAQHVLELEEQAVKDANAAIAGARHRFDTFAATTYVDGPRRLHPERPRDTIASETTARPYRQVPTVMVDLQRARPSR